MTLAPLYQRMLLGKRERTECGTVLLWANLITEFHQKIKTGAPEQDDGMFTQAPAPVPKPLKQPLGHYADEHMLLGQLLGRPRATGGPLAGSAAAQPAVPGLQPAGGGTQCNNIPPTEPVTSREHVQHCWQLGYLLGTRSFRFSFHCGRPEAVGDRIRSTTVVDTQPTEVGG